MFKGIKMGKLVLWLAGIMVVSLSLAAVIFFSSGSMKIFSGAGVTIHGKFDKEINEEKTIQTDGLKNLNISSVSEDIRIIPGTGNAVRAHLYGGISSSNENYYPTLDVQTAGETGVIEVKWPNAINIGYMNSNLKLDIYLPESYNRSLKLTSSSGSVEYGDLNLQNFECSTTSGDLKGKMVNAENTYFETSSGRYETGLKASGEFRMESTSGDFTSNYLSALKVTRNTSSGTTNITSLECGDFRFNSTSGDITVGSIKAGTSSVETSSGTVKLNGPSTEKVTVKSTSGDITWEGIDSKSTGVETSAGKLVLKGNPGSLESHSTSGDIELNYDAVTGPSKLESSSGTIKLTVPSDAQFGLDFGSSAGILRFNGVQATVSGELEDHGFKGYVGSDVNTIKINTTSGDVTISKK